MGGEDGREGASGAFSGLERVKREHLRELPIHDARREPLLHEAGHEELEPSASHAAGRGRLPGAEDLPDDLGADVLGRHGRRVDLGGVDAGLDLVQHRVVHAALVSAHAGVVRGVHREVALDATRMQVGDRDAERLELHAERLAEGVDGGLGGAVGAGEGGREGGADGAHDRDAAAAALRLRHEGHRGLAGADHAEDVGVVDLLHVLDRLQGDRAEGAEASVADDAVDEAASEGRRGLLHAGLQRLLASHVALQDHGGHAALLEVHD
mmetsp:Transcript_73509/g.192805  ORF Transcript_73509/g.192805 Transcript_73509/m.192805 type:complete len:267 (-) Transcript_73509:195-995(-)